MDGKRFGVGLVAGLLLGLAIVTASGGLGSASVVFGPLSPSHPGAAETATKTVTTKVLSATTLSTSSGGSPAYSVNPTNSTQGSVSNLPSSVSTSTTTSNGQSDLTFGGSSAKSPSYSSRIVSIAQQPLLSNAVIFVPVLVAFLLGAVLYRASRRNETDSVESQP
jgi:hypothetical protein